MNAARADLDGLPVTVMGLGLFGGGVETARWLVQHGARVTVTDLRSAEQLRESVAALAGLPIRYVLGGHERSDFTGAGLVVANPAVAPEHELLAGARAAGVRVTSEAALFLEACPARLVLVTGTQGKSSTVHLAHGLIEACGLRAHLGGNIGRSLLGALQVIEEGDLVVMELSSYQLESLPPAGTLQPRCAAIGVVNVRADHLERHGSVAAYAAAKRRILELAGDDTWVLLNSEDPLLAGWSAPRGQIRRYGLSADRALDLGLRGGQFVHGDVRLGDPAELRLLGPFQASNALCALGLALAVDARPADLARALPTLGGLEHRLQDLGLVAGRRVFDNGVSTTPDSTQSAIAALEPPLCLLIGGQQKALPMQELVQAGRGRLRRVIAFGASREGLLAPFRAAGFECEACAELPAAVARAFERMQPGEALLFSPAAASFDAYRNFRDRARAFRAALADRDAAAARRWSCDEPAGSETV